MSGVTVLAICVAVALLLYWKYPTEKLPPKWLFTMRTTKRWVLQIIYRVRLITLIKITTSYYQVLLLVRDIYDIPFPKIYVNFLLRWFSVFELDFLKFAKVECVQKTNFYEVMLIGSCTMLLLEFLAVGFFVQGNTHNGAVCLILAYFLYSPVAATVFQTFNCRKIDGGWYLTKDYSMSCETSMHYSYQVFAGE
jgi:hypothetical protein